MKKAMTIAAFAAGLFILVGAGNAFAQDYVQRRMFVEKPAYPAAPALAELVYQMTLATAADNGGVDIVATAAEADALMTIAIEGGAGGRATIRIKTWDKLAFAGRDDIKPVEKSFALDSLGAGELYDAFALPLGRWVSTEFPLVEPRVREIVKYKVVSEIKTIDLSKGASLLVKSDPGATLELFDGRSFVFDANGIVKIEGIPQNSTIRFTVGKAGYYSENATVVFGRLDEKLMVMLDPIDRFHLGLETTGPMGLLPTFGWEAIPDTLTVGFVPATNVEYVSFFYGDSMPPTLYYAQPELFVMYRLGSQANPVWFDAGLGAWLRFDIEGAYPYDMGLSKHYPWGVRMRFSASGRIAEGWSLTMSWQPTFLYSETYVSDLMSQISGRPKYEASEFYRYDDHPDFIFFDPRFPLFLSLFEIMGGVVFSF